jgi:hypothetical protein
VAQGSGGTMTTWQVIFLFGGPISSSSLMVFGSVPLFVAAKS